MPALNPLAAPARWTWVAILLLILLLHVPHAVRMHGIHRLWHVGHALMAAGMGYMFVPLRDRGDARWPWEIIYGAAFAFAAGYAVLRLRNGSRIDMAWITLTIGMAGMVCMWAMAGRDAWGPVGPLAAIWFAAESVGWFTGALAGQRATGWLPAAIGPPHGGARARAPCLGGSTPLAQHASWLTRTTLGLMALAMAYMFAFAAI